MNPHEETQAYRASVAAIIVDKELNFFLVQQPDFGENEWDFVKGGMFKGESEADTLKREVREELGEEIRYKILRRSIWNIIYEWPLEKQIKKGYRGQARISYWVMYEGGKISVNTSELTATKWFKESEIEEILIQSGAREQEVKIFLDDLALIKEEFKDQFTFSSQSPQTLSSHP